MPLLQEFLPPLKLVMVNSVATVRGIFGKESPPCLVRERLGPRSAHSKARRALRIPAFARCCPVLGVGERYEIAFSEGSPRHGDGFLPAASVFVAEGIVLAAGLRLPAAGLAASFGTRRHSAAGLAAPGGFRRQVHCRRDRLARRLGARTREQPRPLGVSIKPANGVGAGRYRVQASGHELVKQSRQPLVRVGQLAEDAESRYGSDGSSASLKPRHPVWPPPR